MSRRKWCAAALAACLAAGLAGCGSGPSEDDYRGKANAVCRQTVAQVSAIPVPDQNDLPATGRYLHRVTDLLQQGLDRLQKLPRPDKDDQRLSDLFHREESAIQLYRQAAQAADASDKLGAQQAAQQARTELTDVQLGLSDFGLTDCAQ